jgi:ABC-type transport system involved in multi-copper enzyme maturation permease subunit
MILTLIAKNTFREATRDRVLGGIVIAGIALLGITQLASPLALGEGRRLTVDLGLSAISVLGVLVVLLVGTSLVAKEIERRTLYNLLSRPITRHAYLIGKWAGLTVALVVAALMLGAALCLVLAVRGEARHFAAVAQAVYLAMLELAVITSVAVLFSALSTPVLSSLYTLALYMVGQWSYDLRAFARQFTPGLRGIIDVAANLVPNLPLFNMRSLAAEAQTTSAMHLGIATAYAALYCAAMLALATVAFRSRDFK